MFFSFPFTCGGGGGGVGFGLNSSGWYFGFGNWIFQIKQPKIKPLDQAPIKEVWGGLLKKI